MNEHGPDRQSDPSDATLRRVAGQLGARAAGRLDVERVATRVLDRLKAEPAARPSPLVRWWRAAPGAVRVAAAVALLAAGGLVVQRAARTGNGEGTPAALPLIGELSSEELAEVLDSLVIDVPLTVTQGRGLVDLDETQLRQLLALMEG